MIINGNVTNNNVDHPSHYTFGEIECIDAIRSSMSEESYRGYLKGNIMKYIWRVEHKNKPLEDLEKAMWYLSKLHDSIARYEIATVE